MCVLVSSAKDSEAYSTLKNRLSPLICFIRVLGSYYCQVCLREPAVCIKGKFLS